VDLIVLQQLAVAFGLGLLLGLQRERTESSIGGIRTFPLITLFGTVVAANRARTALDVQRASRAYQAATQRSEQERMDKKIAASRQTKAVRLCCRNRAAAER
jgi:hypothetical protein